MDSLGALRFSSDRPSKATRVRGGVSGKGSGAPEGGIGVGCIWSSSALQVTSKPLWRQPQPQPLFWHGPLSPKQQLPLLWQQLSLLWQSPIPESTSPNAGSPISPSSNSPTLAVPYPHPALPKRWQSPVPKPIPLAHQPRPSPG